MKYKNILVMVLISWSSGILGYSADNAKTQEDQNNEEAFNTHGNMTRIAIKNSTLSHPPFLSKVGLPEIDLLSINEEAFYPEDSERSKKVINYFPNAQGNNMTIYQLIPFGVHFEDNISPFTSVISTDPWNLEIGEFRVFNHFYDVQNNGDPLTISGVTAGRPSLQWAIEGKDMTTGVSIPPIVTVDAYTQHFSYPNARDYFYSALTEPDFNDRKRGFGLMFQTLGHIVHHFQDMAQPQHVRNDTHLPWEDDFFETWMKNEYDYEAIETLVTDYPYNNQAPVLLPRALDYGDWEGNTADRGVDRIGMAEFTGTNFIGADINFVGDPNDPQPHPGYPLPLALNTTGLIDISEAADDCGLDQFDFTGNHEITGQLNWVTTEVNDRYLPPVVPPNELPRNVRASTYSIWYQEIENARIGGWQIPQGREFTVNECVFKERLKFVIPRAVAFSAGLFDYFFRGELEITAPDGGVYALKDYYLGNDTVTLNAEGKTVVNGLRYGYNKLLLNLQNTTETIELPNHSPFTDDNGPTSIPQQMFGGDLRAIVKYSLNHCYQHDGSGEFGADSLANSYSLALDGNLSALATRAGSCDGDAYFSNDAVNDNDDLTLGIRRRDYEQIAMSERVIVDHQVAEDNDSASGGFAVSIPRIPTDSPTLLAFDFSSDPIPLNAIDVRLQIVYRGKMGPEDVPTMVEQDAVAVGTQDISEPSDVMVANFTDHVLNLPEFPWAKISALSEEDGLLPEPYTVALDPTFLQPGTYTHAFQSYSGTGSIPIPTLNIEFTVPSRYEVQLESDGLPLAGRDNPLSGELNVTVQPQDAQGDQVSFIVDGTSIQSTGTYDLTLDTAQLSNGRHTLTTAMFYANEFIEFDSEFVVNNDPTNTAPVLDPIANVDQVVTGNLLTGLDVPLVISDAQSTLDVDDVSIHSEVEGLINLSQIMRVEANPNGGVQLHFFDYNEHHAHADNFGLMVLPSHIKIRVTVTDGELENSQIFTYRRFNGDVLSQGYFDPVEIIASGSNAQTFDVNLTDYGDLNATASVTQNRYFPNYGAGDGDISLDGNANEGLLTLTAANTIMENEWTTASGDYDNLSVESLLKKLIDRGTISQMPSGITPDHQFITEVNDLGFDFKIQLSNGVMEDLATISGLDTGEFVKFGLLGGLNTPFKLLRGNLGLLSQCASITPESRQWHEGTNLYVQDGISRKMGATYSLTRLAADLLCESAIKTTGNANFVSDASLTDNLETALDSTPMTQVQLMGLHGNY